VRVESDSELPEWGLLMLQLDLWVYVSLLQWAGAVAIGNVVKGVLLGPGLLPRIEESGLKPGDAIISV